jgi:large subunit ribosomal protein L18
MKTTKSKTEQRARRKARIRAKIFGTKEMPRLAVFKSNRYISAQIIDDSASKTLCSAHSKTIKGKTLLEKSAGLGLEIATAAKAKKIGKVVFDRGGFQYVGAVKAVAEGARKGGLKF